MNTTIHDVAYFAEVSIATVSRVINNSAPVSEQKRTRVLDAIKALNFTPNPAAQSLIRHATGTIGAILPSITGEFFADLLSGLDVATRQHNYLLMVSASRRLKSDFITALESMNKRVDGLIVMAPELTADQVHSLVDPSIPIVFLNTNTNSSELFSVNFDNYGGMVKIAKHITELGHTHVAFIGGPDAASDAIERRRGFSETIGDHVKMSYYVGDFTLECGYEIAEKIVNASPPIPSVIVAANDLSALGAMRYLLQHGLKIPDEISVTGFDGTKSACFSTPPLTTVNIPIGLIAASSINYLVSQLTNSSDNQPDHIKTPMELIVRESSQLTPM